MTESKNKKKKQRTDDREQKQMEKEKYWLRKVAKYDYIILYGAGLVGGLTAKRLLANGLEHKIVGYAVSKRDKESPSGEKVNELYVYEIQELKRYAKEALVIVATMPVLHDVITRTLRENGFEQYSLVTTKLYDSFCRNYIADFRRTKTVSFPENVKKRILFLASDNNRTSGAFLCMAELCEMIEEQRKRKQTGKVEDDFAVLVVLPEYGTGEELLIQKGIPYTYIPSKDWGYEIARDQDGIAKLKFAVGQLSNYKAKRELERLIREQSVNLVHCNTTYTYVGALAAKACGIPVVWHLRENMEHQGYRFFTRKWALRLIQQAEQIIAVSEYIRYLLPIRGPEQIRVVYDAVELGTLPVRERVILGMDTVHMLIVGAITPYKGQEELIEACYLLSKKKEITFHLQIVGTGEAAYVEQLREKTRQYHLERQVEFYGASREVGKLYEKADIVFMCSKAEPYGRVTVEAMMTGCLVIGARSGATTELIRAGETGFLYEPGNAGALADCIQKAVSCPEQSRILAKKGQAFARRTFTKERNLCQILEVYREVLRK